MPCILTFFTFKILDVNIDQLEKQKILYILYFYLISVYAGAVLVQYGLCSSDCAVALLQHTEIVL